MQKSVEYPKKVAIIRLSAMGDIIHTAASIQFIKAKFPDMKIVWFCDEAFAEILKYNLEIDEVVSIPLRSLKQKFSFKKLKKIYKILKNSGEFDLIIDVQGLLKSALVARVIGKNIYGLDYFSAREKLAVLFYKKKFRVNCKEIAPFRFAKLLSNALGFEISKEMLLEKKPYLFWDKSKNYELINSYFETSKKTILLVVGASKASKIYPKKSWIEVISHLRMYNILILAGNKKEREFAKEIEENSIAKLLPKIDLNELKYLVSKIDLLIGNDTGPTHAAWALNKASIVLFGSTPVTMMMQTSKNIAISLDPNFRACRFDKNNKNIQKIKPALVVKKALELLGNE
jgi:heptosyltransferase-1